METTLLSRSPPRTVLAGSWLFLVLFLCSQFYLLLPVLGLPRQWSTALLKALPEIVVWIGLSTLLVFAVRRWPPPRPAGRWLVSHGVAAVASSALAIAGSALLWRGVGLLVGQDWPLAELLAQISDLRLHLGILIYMALLGFAVVDLSRGRPVAPTSATPGSDAFESPEAPRRLRHLVARERGRSHIIDVDEVVWVEAARNYAIVHTETASHAIRMTFTELESALAPERFARVHRSAIVAVDRIRELLPRAAGERELLLADGTRLTLTRTFRDRLETALGQRV